MPPAKEQARIREFVQALNEEIAAILGGGKSVIIYDGRFKRCEAQFFVYVFRQLAPICTGRTEMVQKWLARDIFSQAGIRKLWTTSEPILG